MRDIDTIIEDWKYMRYPKPEDLIERFDRIASSWMHQVDENGKKWATMNGDTELVQIQCNDLGSLVYLAATLLKENKQLRKELDSQWS